MFHRRFFFFFLLDRFGICGIGEPSVSHSLSTSYGGRQGAPSKSFILKGLLQAAVEPQRCNVMPDRHVGVVPAIGKEVNKDLRVEAELSGKYFFVFHGHIIAQSREKARTFLFFLPYITHSVSTSCGGRQGAPAKSFSVNDLRGVNPSVPR